MLNIDSVIEQSSKYVGSQLVAFTQFKDGLAYLTIEGKNRNLFLTLYLGSSRRDRNWLREVYGRIRNFGITEDGYDQIVKYLIQKEEEYRVCEKLNTLLQ